jgi:hypothetical protein
MTNEEKINLFKELYQTMTRFEADSYKPFMPNGQIEQKAICVIKSTLLGRPAISNGCYALVYPSKFLDGMPEVNAQWFHDKNDNFDSLVESVLAESPIQPLFYDEYGLYFDNSALLNRQYFDIVWLVYHAKQLNFAQDPLDPRGPILVKSGLDIVGVVMPCFLDKMIGNYSDEQIRPVIKSYCRYLTDPDFGKVEEVGPCEKCGGTNDVGIFGKSEEAGTEGFTICHWCYLDTEGFVEWLANEMREAMGENNGDQADRESGRSNN